METNYPLTEEKLDQGRKQLEMHEIVLDYYLDTRNGAIEGIPQISTRLANIQNFHYVEEIISDADNLIREQFVGGRGKSYCSADDVRKIEEKTIIFKQSMVALGRRLNDQKSFWNKFLEKII